MKKLDRFVDGFLICPETHLLFKDTPNSRRKLVNPQNKTIRKELMLAFKDADEGKKAVSQLDHVAFYENFSQKRKERNFMEVDELYEGVTVVDIRICTGCSRAAHHTERQFNTHCSKTPNSCGAHQFVSARGHRFLIGAPAKCFYLVKKIEGGIRPRVFDPDCTVVHGYLPDPSVASRPLTMPLGQDDISDVLWVKSQLLPPLQELSQKDLKIIADWIRPSTMRSKLLTCLSLVLNSLTKEMRLKGVFQIRIFRKTHDSVDWINNLLPKARHRYASFYTDYILWLIARFEVPSLAEIAVPEPTKALVERLRELVKSEHYSQNELLDLISQINIENISKDHTGTLLHSNAHLSLLSIREWNSADRETATAPDVPEKRWSLKFPSLYNRAARLDSVVYWSKALLQHGAVLPESQSLESYVNEGQNVSKLLSVMKDRKAAKKVSEENAKLTYIRWADKATYTINIKGININIQQLSLLFKAGITGFRTATEEFGCKYGMLMPTIQEVNDYLESQKSRFAGRESYFSEGFSEFNGLNAFVSPDITLKLRNYIEDNPLKVIKEIQAIVLENVFPILLIVFYGTPRGAELAKLAYRDLATSKRSYFLGGIVHILRDKNSNRLGKNSEIQRSLHTSVAELLNYYIVVLLPLVQSILIKTKLGEQEITVGHAQPDEEGGEAVISDEDLEDDDLDLEEEDEDDGYDLAETVCRYGNMSALQLSRHFIFMDGLKPLTQNKISSTVTEFTFRVLGKAVSIRSLRHITIFFQRLALTINSELNISLLVGAELEMASGHSVQTGMDIYANVCNESLSLSSEMTQGWIQILTSGKIDLQSGSSASSGSDMPDENRLQFISNYRDNASLNDVAARMTGGNFQWRDAKQELVPLTINNQSSGIVLLRLPVSWGKTLATFAPLITDWVINRRLITSGDVMLSRTLVKEAVLVILPFITLVNQYVKLFERWAAEFSFKFIVFDPANTSQEMLESLFAHYDFVLVQLEHCAHHGLRAAAKRWSRPTINRDFKDTAVYRTENKFVTVSTLVVDEAHVMKYALDYRHQAINEFWVFVNVFLKPTKCLLMSGSIIAGDIPWLMSKFADFKTPETQKVLTVHDFGRQNVEAEFTLMNQADVPLNIKKFITKWLKDYPQTNGTPKKRLLVLVNNIAMIRECQFGEQVAHIHSQVSSSDRAVVQAEFALETHPLAVVIATTAANTGLDFAGLNDMLMVGSPDMIDRIQGAGRIARAADSYGVVRMWLTHRDTLQKTDAQVYGHWDRAKLHQRLISLVATKPHLFNDLVNQVLEARTNADLVSYILKLEALCDGFEVIKNVESFFDDDTRCNDPMSDAELGASLTPYTPQTIPTTPYRPLPTQADDATTVMIDTGSQQSLSSDDDDAIDQEFLDILKNIDSKPTATHPAPATEKQLEIESPPRKRHKGSIGVEKNLLPASVEAKLRSIHFQNLCDAFDLRTHRQIEMFVFPGVSDIELGKCISCGSSIHHEVGTRTKWCNIRATVAKAALCISKAELRSMDDCIGYIREFKSEIILQVFEANWKKLKDWCEKGVYDIADPLREELVLIDTPEESNILHAYHEITKRELPKRVTLRTGGIIEISSMVLLPDISRTMASIVARAKLLLFKHNNNSFCYQCLTYLHHYKEKGRGECQKKSQWIVYILQYLFDCDHHLRFIKEPSKGSSMARCLKRIRTEPKFTKHFYLFANWLCQRLNHKNAKDMQIMMMHYVVVSLLEGAVYEY